MPRELRVAWFGHAAGRRADGLSTYSRQTVTALERKGCRVRFFHHLPDGDDAPTGDSVALRARRFKTVTLPAPGTAERIEAALRRFRPDIVHTSWSFSLLDGAIGRAAREAGAAAVATYHLPYTGDGSARGLVLRGLYRWHRRPLLEYDVCIALSEGQRRLLIEAGVPAEMIVRVANAVDAGAITPGPSQLRDRLGASLVVGYMGRLDPEKRVGALVDAFVRLGWPSDHHLVIAGDGSQAAALRERASRHPNVHLLGLVTGPAERLDVLRAADIAVLPSTAEGLSLSLLEAMAAGSAVVCTDTGEDGAALGEGGILIPSRPLEPGLSEALRRLGGDPELRRRLGGEARRRAEAEFSLDRHADRLLQLYRHVLGEEGLHRGGHRVERVGEDQMPGAGDQPQLRAADEPLDEARVHGGDHRVVAAVDDQRRRRDP